ncbi:MAG TPA: hypothetical protein V6D12_24485 [Candidatus Obscuribacterales bacterium]
MSRRGKAKLQGRLEERRSRCIDSGVGYWHAWRWRWFTAAMA